MTIDQLNKQSMTTADILKANEWEFCPSIDRGGVAQPEYWTHPDHNGPFTEEEAFRQHESDSGLDGLINQWAETNNALQRELSAVCEERDALKRELQEETAIVSRIWKIFGSPTYEELNGKSIYELIEERINPK